MSLSNVGKWSVGLNTIFLVVIALSLVLVLVLTAAVITLVLLVSPVTIAGAH